MKGRDWYTLHTMCYALRTLLRHPSSTAVAVISLALGIGANSLVFSIVHGCSSCLAVSGFGPSGIHLVHSELPQQKRAATAKNFFALREQSQILEHIGTVGGVEDNATITGGIANPQSR